ncbi:MAG: hypothetical protein M3401_13225 [Actinomycetota bacterium]|nr:hypothetical protein [Actinomycetota bacterium]
MIAALAWGIAAGFLARAIVGGEKPSLPVTLLAGFAGSVIAFFVGHELLGLHEIHLFAPEGLLPASAAALGLLLAAGRLRRGGRRTMLGR